MTVATVHPYNVVPSSRDLATHFANVNDQLYQNYSCDYTFGGPDKIVTGTLSDFERLLEGLAAIPHVEFVTHREMAHVPCPPDRLRIGFRHDIDGDIPAALEQARLQQQYGVRATWYVLHSAPYYGQFREDRFERFECMAPVYLELQRYGHEVALHTDPLGIYQFNGFDGAEAVRQEIAWLREIGIELRGSVAHNSKPVYGAWNYEIFKRRRDPDDDRPEHELPDHVIHQGKWAALRVLDEAALGLEYEGNDVLWQKHTPLEYGATRAANLWRWQAHDRRRRKAPESPETRFFDQERMVAEIQALDPGRFVVLVVHPCYYGARAAQRGRPTRCIARSSTRRDETLGWFTWDAAHVQSFGERRRDSGPGHQAIHRPNEFGMLDKPWPALEDIADHVRILLLGAENPDGATVPGPRHVARHLESLFEEHAGRHACVRQLAHPGMGITRLWSWLDRAAERLDPQVVIMGIGDRAAQQCLPILWARELGVSWQQPPGDFLAWDAESGTISPMREAAHWALHRTTPKCLTLAPRSQLRLADLLGQEEPGVVRDVDVDRFLEAAYTHVATAIRERGAHPVLLVEDLGEARGLDAGREADRQEQSRLRQRIARIAELCDCPVVDPYPLFAATDLSVHQDTCRQWNGTGHRLAAEALYAGVRPIVS